MMPERPFLQLRPARPVQRRLRDRAVRFWVEGSHRIKEEFDNDKRHYTLHGQRIVMPVHVPQHPDQAALGW